uniref:Histone deacetylase complex subunit SAP30L n=1 Tax=Phallusia mammillata TaxID=59560 RepID=A0A6F9DS66_9ASCI|nr:histone deacetylase complex subunit SAP30L [Phallusia mammillata]
MTLEYGNNQGGKKRKRKDSGDRDGGHDYTNEVALEQLQMNTLRRYKRYYKLQTRQGLTKGQLADTVGRHFRSMRINEKEAIAYFIYMVKMKRNRLDNKDTGHGNGNNNNNGPESGSRESKSRSEHK